MFAPEVYINRRKRLKEAMGSGVLLFPGNTEAAMNYPANTYPFRQDSNFLYFFGLDMPDLYAMINVDEDQEIIFGNDVSMDDVIWMGPQPAMLERAARVGVSQTMPLKAYPDMIRKAMAKGQKIHFLPPYRGEAAIQLAELLGKKPAEIKSMASEALIRAVVALREVKEEGEIKEIERAVDISYIMHTTAMKMAKPGVVEREISGTIEGISLANGNPVAFPVILTINGQTLHNHYHGNTLKEGRFLVVDAGAESPLHYAGDITRSTPVGGKFDARQREIYQIVLDANMTAIQGVRPGVPNKTLHIKAVTTIAAGLKQLGLMKGDVEEAVNRGAHALFMPHGLGHMMGLDVHDMEGLGENYVGYDEEIKRSDQFGLASLRLGKRLKPGFVFTIEPGIYFIPALIDQWKAEGKFTEYIDYSKVEAFRDFGGVRVEDDVLVTEDGYQVLGKPIPKTVDEVEKMAK
ncbi:MAG TPA: M24 family metallopeptidase [Bacteroidetes bacterium]|nr:M24 family metallopeptidase [Bacteroidota bacterium]